MDYSAQAEVSRKTAASIKRLDVLPYVETGTNVFRPISSVTDDATTADDPNQVKLSQTAPSIDFDHPVTIRNSEPTRPKRHARKPDHDPDDPRVPPVARMSS